MTLCFRKRWKSVSRTKCAGGELGVEDDDIVELDGDAVEAFDGSVDDLDEPPRTALVACGTTSHSKGRVGRAKCCDRYHVFMYRKLMARRNEAEDITP